MRVVLRPASGSVKPKQHWSLPATRPGIHSRFLLGRAVNHDRMRPEQIDMHRRGRRHAAAVARHLVHHDGRLGHSETRAAIFLGHGDAEPSIVGHGAVERAWKLAVFVALKPVLVIEARHHRANPLPDGVEMRLAIVIGRRVRLRCHDLAHIRSMQGRAAPASDGECRTSCRRCRWCRRRACRQTPERRVAHAPRPRRTARSSD